MFNLKKKDYVIGSIVIYVFMITLLVTLDNAHTIDNPCTYSQPCVRFCCYDMELCNENFIRKNFNSSMLDSVSDEETQEFKILFGSPTCNLNRLPAKDFNDTWSFSYGGDVIYDEEYIDINFHCVEKSNASDEVSWDLFVCKTNFEVHRVTYFLMSFVSTALLSATIFVYAYLKELRTVAGRCSLGLLTSLLAFHVSITLSHSGSSLAITVAGFGLWLSFIWCSVLSFDIYWTFRYFRTSTDDNGRLKFYLYYVLFFASLGFIFIVEESSIQFHRKLAMILYQFFLISLLCITFLDLLFLILTGVKIFQLSRASSSLESSRFESEKDRFWTYVELHGILIITWPIEVLFYFSAKSYNPLIVADFVRSFSYLLIFTIFVLRKNVRILWMKQYQRLREVLP